MNELSKCRESSLWPSLTPAVVSQAHSSPLPDIAIQAIQDASGKLLEKIQFPNNNIYLGKTFHCVPHGPGEMVYACGVKYIGEFANGMRHGNGKLFLLDDSRYEGNFANDKKDGKGIMYFSKEAKELKYDGEFANDMRHGFGTMYLKNGDKFTGEYRNDFPNGEGVYEYRNGSTCKGVYKNNQIVEGTLTLSDQRKFSYSPMPAEDSQEDWREV